MGPVVDTDPKVSIPDGRLNRSGVMPYDRLRYVRPTELRLVQFPCTELSRESFGVGAPESDVRLAVEGPHRAERIEYVEFDTHELPWSTITPSKRRSGS